MSAATSPQGALYLDAQKRAKGKVNGHESKAKCGCAVHVAWFSEDSHSVTFKPCHEHAPRKG